MVAKMMKWRPWPILITKKFQLSLLLHSLEGLSVGDNGGLEKSKLMVHIEWKGSKGKLGSRFGTIKRNCTARQCIGENGIVEWNESFDRACAFTMAKDNVFHRWDVSFEVIDALAHESKTRPSIVATAFLNLGEFASTVNNSQHTIKVPVSRCIEGVAAEAALVVTLSFVDLQTTQDAFIPLLIPRILLPSLSCIGRPLLSEKEEVPAPKAGLREEKNMREYVKRWREKKGSSDEDASDCKLSPRSEEFESADLFDSESADKSGEDEAEDGDGSTFWSSFNYGTLATANLIVGRVYLDCKEDGYGDDNSMIRSLSLDSMPKLIDEPSSSDSDHALPQPSMRALLSWKSRKLSFKSPRRRGEPLLNKAYREEGGDDIDFDRRHSGFPVDPPHLEQHKSKNEVAPNVSGYLDFGDDHFTIGSWEQKELVSRDGQMKLSAQVFFASIDQRSERAAGESACTALVAVIADWLHNNPNSMPIKSQFDMLIREGSLEWRKLCDVEAYRERFPDRHFDLDTIIQAKVRPLSVIPGKSFVGFFRSEGLGNSFEFLQGAMSFDNIWEEIISANMGETEHSEPHIYIVSWNDHFFVLKVEREAFYIIDTLGERLFEGCNQAYILKFDRETALYEIPPREKKVEEEKNITASQSSTTKDSKAAKKEDPNPSTTDTSKPAIKGNVSQKRPENAETQIRDATAPETACIKHNEEKLICKGKESCKEFINGFFAALPLRELQVDMKKGLMGKIPLHHRLQIEFHFTAERYAPPMANTAHVHLTD